MLPSSPKSCRLFSAAICGQSQYRRRSRKLLFPVSDLALQRLPLQPLPLPEGIIGILNARCRQRRGVSSREGIVERTQFSCQQALGPSIACDVMEGKQQDMFVGLKFNQLCSEHAIVCQVEGLCSFLLAECEELCLVLFGFEVGQIQHR